MENSQTEKKCPCCGKENSMETPLCSCGYYFDLDLYEKKRIAYEKQQNPSSGIRIANFLIDTFTIFIIIFMFIFIIGDSLNTINFYVLNFLVFFLYYFILEGSSGRTFGKLITRTKVVSLDDQEPNGSTIALRTICRFIPFEPFSFFDYNGWHDSISKTKVVFA